MSAGIFIKRQITQIRQGGRAVLLRKMNQAWQILLKLPLYIIAVPVVLVLRLIRPWLLVRWGGLVSSRIGHFAANTELYLCEQDSGIGQNNGTWIFSTWGNQSAISNWQQCGSALCLFGLLG